MNERLKELRIFLGLSQKDFADKLGVAPTNICGYEQGRRNPSDAVISLICQTFGASETWLRDGTMPMFVELSRDAEIAKMVADAQFSDDFRYQLLSCLASLDAEEWKVLKKIATSLQLEDKIKE